MKKTFCCPVCGEELNLEERTYRCEKGHCFDAAKEGYVNLFASGKGKDIHGDDKEMVASRTMFLEGGYYKPLRDKICEIVKEMGKIETSLLDAGCGEGYYTGAYSEITTDCVGVDISKAAVKHAAKHCKNARFAVASVYHLPLPDDSFDVVVNCFSPNAPEEFSRVLKNDGLLVYVVPAPKHLWELKEILYDTPYENQEKTEEYPGFELCDIYAVTTKFALDTNEKIQALFHMTPYTWNTPKDGAERLSDMQRLDVTADFRIHVYKCKK